MPTMEIQLDGRATTVRWTLKSLFHTARGTFHLQSGDVVANLKTGLAQGEVTVDAASGSSGPGAGGNAARDARWQKDMLQSATYPAILFHPAKIEGLKAGEGEQEATASGVMTLQGHDHAIEMRLHVVVKGQKVTIASHFTVPYAEWGVKQPSAGLGRYDKQVTIDVEATGTWTLRMARTDKR